MRIKKDKCFYERRAKIGFKTLMIYYNVTRPQFEIGYRGKDGKFSKEEMFNQLDFLKKWDKCGSKKRLAHQYATYAKRFNYTFGIPSRLVEKVLGKDGDDKRISVKLVLALLSDVVEEVNAGTRTRNFMKVAWWVKKYMFKNNSYWNVLLDKPQYSKLETFPQDEEGFTKRAIEIIFYWNKHHVMKKEAEKPSISEDELKNAYCYGVLTDDEYKQLATKLFNTDEKTIELRRKWVSEHPEFKKSGEELNIYIKRFNELLGKW